MIYISRNKDKIVIEGNNFSQNIGMYGGAVTINSPDWSLGMSPAVVIANNSFTGNMAYLSGNAVYIRTPQNDLVSNSFCGGVTLENNSFTGNIGLKIHNGGAVSFVCSVLPSTHDAHDDNAVFTYNKSIPTGS